MAIFDQLAPEVIKRLSADLQLSPEQAAGVVGQLGFESNGLQTINERKPTVPGSRGGFGWAQWTGPRRKQFESWAKDNNMDTTSQEANYRFLVHELKDTPESRVLPSLRNAPDAQSAGRAFTDGFLRPGIKGYDGRKSWTEKAMDFIVPPAQAGEKQPNMADRVAKAKEAGYSDAEIMERINANPDMSQRIQKARDAGYSDDEIFGRMGISSQPKQQDTQQADGYLSQIGSGLLEGVTGALGAPIDLTNSAIGLGLRGINSALGTDLQPSQEPLGGSRGLRQGLPISPPSNDMGPQLARRVSQSVGAAAIPVGATAKTGQEILAGIGTAVGGGLGGAAAQQAAPGNVPAELFGELLGSMGAGGSISGLANRSNRIAAEKSVPSVEQLKNQAAGKFDDAHRMGVTANQQQTSQLASDIRGIAQKEGLISPTGRLSEAYPKAREAIKMMDDYGQGSMTIPQMQTVRKVLSDAAGSPDSAEKRMATMMLKKFDDFTAPLSPHLSQARALYSRSMRGKQLETLNDLAGSRAGQFSGSGYENALRTEYRGLDRRITKGKELGWSPEQTEAIRRVARGTKTSNSLRNIGKLAPTGIVSGGLSGGVPFMIGNAMGGPGLGAAAAATSMGSGLLARDLATKMGTKYADLAEALARSGGTMPKDPNLWPQILSAMLSGQAAAQSD